MKKSIFFLTGLLAISQLSFATETEPNNTYALANTLQLNISDDGAINPFLDVDWWKVTTGVEGKVVITLNPINKIYFWVEIYDADGVTKLSSKTLNTSFTTQYDGAAAGTFYVKVFAYYANEKGSYSLSSNLIEPVQTNDLEPNDKKSMALGLPLNGSTTGHLGYYNYQYRDTADWYKVTTNEDGILRIKLTPANGQYVWINIYNYNGTIVLGSGNSNASFFVSADGLAAGTYFIKVNCYYTYGFAPYTLSDSLLKPTYAKDAEPNGLATQALPLSENTSVTGHIGYYNSFIRDTTDWYKIQTSIDGKLSFNLTPANGQYLLLTLYDADAKTILEQKNSNATFNMVKDGLAKGYYYVKINAYYSYGFSPYLLTDSSILPIEANDKEPNDIPAYADTLPLSGKVTGLIGYYQDHRRDTTDWYTVTTNADGILKLALTPVNGQYVSVALFDKDGKTKLNSCNNNTTFTCSTDGLAAGTYYVSVYSYYTYGFSTYILADSLQPATPANDKEPNNSKSAAKVLALNKSATGHIGYLNANKRDSADWYKLTTTKDGKLRLSLTPINGQYLSVYLFDNNGTSLLKSDNSKVKFSIERSDLATGTYYVKVTAYYTNGYSPYILSDSFFAATPLTDVEPNNTISNAQTLSVNSSTNGHVGYYYKLQRDSADWYKLSATANGKLKLFLTPLNGENVSLYLLDSTGKNVLLNASSSTIVTLTKNNLIKGTYYVKVTAYHTDGFTPYKLTDSLLTTGAKVYDVFSASPILINIPQEEKMIKMYPNPVNGIFTLQTTGNTIIQTIMIKDLTGKTIKQLLPTANQTNTRYTLDLSELVSGVYFVHVLSADKTSTIQKIIVSH